MKLAHKVALITGSSQGIGKSLALKLAQQGATVILNGRDPDRLQQTLAEFQSEDLKAIAIRGDISLPADCSHIVLETLEQFGRIDILVNNVGVSVSAERIEQVAPEVYQAVAEANYLSAIYMTRAALPHIRSTGGSIVFISSIAGLMGFPENAAYCSAKMALTGFAESLRWELLGSGVHVGIAYIGYTENTAGKKVLAPRGGRALKTHDYAVRLAPIERVSDQLLRMLSRRKYKVYITRSGKVLAWINRYLPGFCNLLFSLYFSRKKRLKKVAAYRKDTGTASVLQQGS